jgi:hypothetical protein
MWGSLLTGVLARPGVRRPAAIALTIGLFLLNFRRTGERAGRQADRLSTTENLSEIQRQMLHAATRRIHWKFMDGPQRTFVLSAANGSSEPKLPDAVLETNW